MRLRVLEKQPIRKTFFLISISFLLCVLLIIVLIGFLFVMPEYYSYETLELNRKVEQLDRIIESEVSHLDLFCRDWAMWTDTWYFLQNRNEAYIESNLGKESLEIGGLSFFLFFNINGDFIYGGWIDPESGKYRYDKEMEFSDRFKSILYVEEETVPRVQTGFLSSEDKSVLYIFSARNVLKSDMTGPAAGTIIAGRLFGSEMLSALSDTLHFHLETYDLADEHLFEEGTTGNDLSYRLKRSGFLHLGDWEVVYPVGLFLSGQNFYFHFSHEPEILFNGVRTAVTISLVFGFIFMLLHVVYQYFVSIAIVEPVLRLTDYVELKSKSFINERTHPEQFPNEIARLTDRFYFLLEKLSEQNLNLAIEAKTDALTGLYRRTPVIERLEALCARDPKDSEAEVCVMMVDIDHFKKINDNWGHPVGDEVLRGIAPLLRSCLRAEDAIGRYGGEEFIVILKDLNLNIVRGLAERIRGRIEDAEWSFGEQVTLSIGYCCMSCPCDHEKLIERADEYLYSAKNNGRNRVEGPMNTDQPQL